MTTPVSQSVLNPVKPTNGATSQTQTQTAPPAAGATATTIEQREAAIAAREKAQADKESAYRNELKKNADEKRGLGAKLSEYEQLKKEVPELRKYKADSEQRSQLRKLNPVSALEEDFGKDWADKVTQLRVNGVPPVDLVASVVTQLKAEFKAELDARDRKTAEQTTTAEQHAIQETRATVATNAARWYEANAKEFPVLERLGDTQRIGAILGQRIEDEFRRSGRLLSDKEAAEGLEADMLGIVETAVKHDKYKAKLQPAETSANVSASSGAPVGAPGSQSSTRRTLDNSMTASTSGRAPPKNDAEREERAMQAFNAARNRGKT